MRPSLAFCFLKGGEKPSVWMFPVFCRLDVSCDLCVTEQATGTEPNILEGLQPCPAAHCIWERMSPAFCFVLFGLTKALGLDTT